MKRLGVLAIAAAILLGSGMSSPAPAQEACREQLDALAALDGTIATKRVELASTQAAAAKACHGGRGELANCNIHRSNIERLQPELDTLERERRGLVRRVDQPACKPAACSYWPSRLSDVEPLIARQRAAISSVKGAAATTCNAGRGELENCYIQYDSIAYLEPALDMLERDRRIAQRQVDACR